MQIFQCSYKSAVKSHRVIFISKATTLNFQAHHSRVATSFVKNECTLILLLSRVVMTFVGEKVIKKNKHISLEILETNLALRIFMD